MPTHYEILGVAENATEREIKTAYKKRALLYHPDKNKASDAEEKFKAIGASFDILSDPIKRAAYDASLPFRATGHESAQKEFDNEDDEQFFNQYVRPHLGDDKMKGNPATNQTVFLYIPAFSAVPWYPPVNDLFDPDAETMRGKIISRLYDESDIFLFDSLEAACTAHTSKRFEESGLYSRASERDSYSKASRYGSRYPSTIIECSLPPTFLGVVQKSTDGYGILKQPLMTSGFFSLGNIINVREIGGEGMVVSNNHFGKQDVPLALHSTPEHSSSSASSSSTSTVTTVSSLLDQIIRSTTERTPHSSTLAKEPLDDKLSRLSHIQGWLHENEPLSQEQTLVVLALIRDVCAVKRGSHLKTLFSGQPKSLQLFNGLISRSKVIDDPNRLHSITLKAGDIEGINSVTQVNNFIDSMVNTKASHTKYGPR